MNRAPYAGFAGYGHLPWWANGIADLVSAGNAGNFYYLSGTSMAAPHVAATAALMLEKNPALSQADAESILKDTATPIPPGGGGDFRITQGLTDLQLRGADATGAGLAQVDAAVAATP